MAKGLLCHFPFSLYHLAQKLDNDADWMLRPQQNYMFYIHKSASLQDCLDFVINTISSEGAPLLYMIGNHVGTLSPNNFSVKYSINRCSDYKDIKIKNVNGYKALIDKINDLNRPALASSYV